MPEKLSFSGWTDYKTHEKAIKERIEFVYDGNIFFEGLNLKDIKCIVAPAYKHWEDTLFYQYVEQFELPLNKAIKTFSKGMPMKASLAIALSHHAELIIMDEPTADLDLIFRRELLVLLQELMVDGNRTIFFSTHITTDLDRIADYIALIQRGELVFNKFIHDIAENYVLVKGGMDLLDRDTEKTFVHIHRASTGFEAITITDFIVNLSVPALYTGATIVIMVVYVIAWGITTVIYQRKAF